MAAAARLDRRLAAAANRARRECLERWEPSAGTCETTVWLDPFLEGDWLTAEQQEALREELKSEEEEGQTQVSC